MKDEKVDSDDEEDEEMEEEEKEIQEDDKEDRERKKCKREGLEDERKKQESDMSALPLSPVHLHTQPEEQKMDYGSEGGEVQVKDRRKAWKKIIVTTSKMGIFKEAMNPQVLVEK